MLQTVTNTLSNYAFFRWKALIPRVSATDSNECENMDERKQTKQEQKNTLSGESIKSDSLIYSERGDLMAANLWDIVCAVRGFAALCQ